MIPTHTERRRADLLAHYRAGQAVANVTGRKGDAPTIVAAAPEATNGDVASADFEAHEFAVPAELPSDSIAPAPEEPLPQGEPQPTEPLFAMPTRVLGEDDLPEIPDWLQNATGAAHRHEPTNVEGW